MSTPNHSNDKAKSSNESIKPKKKNPFGNNIK